MSKNTKEEWHMTGNINFKTMMSKSSRPLLRNLVFTGLDVVTFRTYLSGISRLNLPGTIKAFWASLQNRLRGPQDVGVRPYVTAAVYGLWTCPRCGTMVSQTSPRCTNVLRMCGGERPAYLNGAETPIPWTKLSAEEYKRGKS